MNYKTFIATIAIAVLLFACQQKTNSTSTSSNDINKSIAEKEEKKALIDKLKDPTAYVYKSATGNLYHAYYQIDSPDKKVVIQTPSQILILPQKETWAKGALFSQNQISWEAQSDQISFKSNGKTEILYQISPVVKKFENKKEQIKVTSTIENDTAYVLLEQKDTPNIKLKQTDESDDTIEYSNDTVIWQESILQGKLTIGGEEKYFEYTR